MLQFSKLIEWVHWTFRMHFFSYQGIAFLLLNVNSIITYYNSIYHAGVILGVVLYIIGLQLLGAKKARERKLQNKDKDE